MPIRWNGHLKSLNDARLGKRSPQSQFAPGGNFKWTGPTIMPKTPLEKLRHWLIMNVGSREADEAMQIVGELVAAKRGKRYGIVGSDGVVHPVPMFNEEELDALIDAVGYKHDVAQQNDPRYDAEVWQPLLAKLRSGVPPLGLWQPIETAPKDGTPILVFEPVGPEDTTAAIYVCIWQEGPSAVGTADYPKGETSGWVEARGERYAVWQPTHWMPLPEPPQ